MDVKAGGFEVESPEKENIEGTCGLSGEKVSI